MARLRLAVLASGRGSNLESLLRASKEGRMDADVVLVVSNTPGAGALGVAARAGVRSVVVPSQGLAREAHEREVRAALDAERPDLVLLAGYMRILTPAFIQAYRGRLLNVHPSLLPAFPGIGAQAQAHARGVRLAGCTTHFVTEEVDAGPVVMQAAVPVPPDATADEVRARILEAEHVIYPRTVQLLAEGRARLDGDRVVFRGLPPAPPGAMLVSPEA